MTLLNHAPSQPCTPYTYRYVRFIAHFVRVYERSAPPFARESARWSESQANIDAYVRAGRRMEDVIGLSDYEAYAQLPDVERNDREWPYGSAR
jgi:hypothetical protein